ncbi:unnamed protein product [Brassica oleracea]
MCLDTIASVSDDCCNSQYHWSALHIICKSDCLLFSSFFI